jgi:hypothetical protein
MEAVTAPPTMTGFAVLASSGAAARSACAAGSQSEAGCRHERNSGVADAHLRDEGSGTGPTRGQASQTEITNNASRSGKRMSCQTPPARLAPSSRGDERLWYTNGMSSYAVKAAATEEPKTDMGASTPPTTGPIAGHR